MISLHWSLTLGTGTAGVCISSRQAFYRLLPMWESESDRLSQITCSAVAEC